MDGPIKKATVAAKVRTDVMDALKEIAAKEDRTVSYLLAKAAQEFIERYRDRQEQRSRRVPV